MSILKEFPYSLPRAGQIKILETIEKEFDNADVFVITAPTSAGKTALAMTVMRWITKQKRMKTCYTVPNNILLEQFSEAFPRMHILRKMAWYECDHYEGESCEKVRRRKNDCRKCRDCPYMKARRRSYVVPYMGCNTHSMLANKLHKDVLIMDEAHLLINIIQERAAKRLWHDDYDIPTHIHSYGKLLAWAESKEETWKGDKKFETLLTELREGRHKFLVKKGFEDFRGEPRLCLKLLPVNTNEYAGFLWQKSKKIILMSATINRKDVEALGLDGRRIQYLNADSPIEPWRRAVYPIGEHNMSWKNQEQNMGDLIDLLEAVMKEEQGKGFVHAPYSLASKLRWKLKDHPRLVFHSKEDKLDVFHEWKESDNRLGLVMVASGMEEGVDLNNDIAHWQAICKIPYPSLAEAAIRYKAEQDPDWYRWETAKTLIQACGRVCRGPDDYGITYILDSAFKRFHNEASGMFPVFFKEAIFSGE